MANLIRLSVKGAMPSGEEWSVNPVFSVGATSVATTPAQLNAIAAAAALVAVPTSLRTAMSSATAVTGIRVEARTIAGVLEGQAEAAIASGGGGTGVPVLPFQSSIVCSLRTSAVGARGRGRLYWPATGQLLTAGTHRVSVANITSILSGFQTYLTGLRNAVQATLTGADLVVWSRTGSALNEVTAIQVGDVLDVQRRRRDELIEAYQQTLFV